MNQTNSLNSSGLNGSGLNNSGISSGYGSGFSIFESLKSLGSSLSSTIAYAFYTDTPIYLATGALTLQSDNIHNIVNECFQNLSQNQKYQVYGKVWELAKMIDPRIEGLNWGEEHAFDDLQRLAKALHRLGFLNYDKDVRHEVPCLSSSFGEGGIGSQYFSLGEKLGTDPAIGQIGFVNGMGVPSLEHAGKDVNELSEKLFYKCNLHCVYHATHQKTSQGDTKGFVKDVIRMKAVEGGSYSRTSYLIAQQWVDFLIANPNSCFLQIAHSEGTAHTFAAVRLISECYPDLLTRIRVINFCPAHFLDPSLYPNSGLQAINFVKLEDDVIQPWGTGTNQVNNNSSHVIVVQHNRKEDHPHNCLSFDYTQAAQPYVDNFLNNGSIYFVSNELPVVDLNQSCILSNYKDDYHT